MVQCLEMKILLVLESLSEMRMVARVVASMAESFQLPFSVTAVEVIAAKKALQFAKDLGLSSVVLEGLKDRY